MLKVISTKVTSNRCDVVIEGPDVPSVGSREALDMAQRTAVKEGLGNPGHNNTSGPYPVDEKGETNEDVCTGKTAVVAYRQDFSLLSYR